MNNILSDLVSKTSDILFPFLHPGDNGKVILSLTALRRIECLLPQHIMAEELGFIQHSFLNTSQFTLEKLLDDPNSIDQNFEVMLDYCPEEVRFILDDFLLVLKELSSIRKKDLLHQLAQHFSKINLSLDDVSYSDMGKIFGELIHVFYGQRQRPRENYTPSEVVRLLVNILFLGDTDLLNVEGTTRTLYDPACGTGSTLFFSCEYLREFNPHAYLKVYGQELIKELYDICRLDQIMRGHILPEIRQGNILYEDHYSDKQFDYFVCNPPTDQGSPFLFVQHMIEKFRQDGKASRMGLILSDNCLTTCSNEKDVRQRIFENDWLEAIIALPKGLFSAPQRATSLWVITNQKCPERRSKIQLINARHLYVRVTRSRNSLNRDHIATITKLFGNFSDQDKHVRFVDNTVFTRKPSFENYFNEKK